MKKTSETFKTKTSFTCNAQEAIALLEKWPHEDPEEQRETWEILRTALDADRFSTRKLFPEASSMRSDTRSGTQGKQKRKPQEHSNRSTASRKGANDPQTTTTQGHTKSPGRKATPHVDRSKEH